MSTKLERLLRMDGMIRGGGYPSTKTFMDHFEVSEWTVYDDMRFLKDRFHAPLKHSRSHQGYFYTDKNWKLPTLPVTEGQLLALFLSVELAERYLGTSFEQPLREAVTQISEMLPKDVLISMSELAHHISIRSGAGAQTSPEILLALQQAIQDHHPVDMRYFTASRSEENQRVVHPYHLMNIRGEWYLIAYDLLRQNVRQFALPRIRSWNILTGERFDIDQTFSPDNYFRASFQAEHGEEVVDILLFFDAYQAHYIRERKLHPTQEIEDNPDGSITVRLKTGALDEVKRQILSYGKRAKVLAPMSLATMVIEESKATTQLYQ